METGPGPSAGTGTAAGTSRTIMELPTMADGPAGDCCGIPGRFPRDGDPVHQASFRVSTVLHPPAAPDSRTPSASAAPQVALPRNC